MEITKEKLNSKLTLSIIGRLDTTTAPQLENIVTNELNEITDFVLDFENLEYISSAGLRVILKAQKIMNTQGKMHLTHVNEDIREIFDITGFSDIVTFDD